MGLFTRKKPIIYETPYTASLTGSVVMPTSATMAPPRRRLNQKRPHPAMTALRLSFGLLRGTAWGAVAVSAFAVSRIGMPAGRFVVRQLARDHSRRRFLKMSSALVLAGAGAFLSSKGHITLPNFDDVFSRDTGRVEIKNLEVVQGQSAQGPALVERDAEAGEKASPIIIKPGPSKVKFVIEEPAAASVAPIAQETAPEQVATSNVATPPAAAFDQNVPAHVEARIDKEVENWSRWAPKAIKHAMKSGLVPDIKKISEWTGFPSLVLLTIPLLESTLGVNPAAGNDYFQVKPGTLFDNLAIHGKELQRILAAHDKNGQSLKKLNMILPYIEREYDKGADKFYFVYHNEKFKNKHKNNPLLKGRKNIKVTDFALEIVRGDPKIAGGLSALRLLKAVEDAREIFKNDAGATAYIDGMGDNIFRLAHAFGPAGLNRIIKHRDSKVTDAFPDPQIRKYFGIADKGPADLEIKRLILAFDGVQTEAGASLVEYEYFTQHIQKETKPSKTVVQKKQGKAPAAASIKASGAQARQTLLAKQSRKNTALLAKAR